ncbi:MAG TPA: DNA polymerase I [Armatimonadota bacterium]|nr:DNA polymerase I [Armatimonadota bacterium]
MSDKGKKVILIDGNSLLYRAFFALPHFSTLENQPTNAVYGFTMMLLRLVEEEKPDIILVAFDAPVKTFRHTEFEDYKAHRKPTPDELRSQAPFARKLVRAFHIPVLEEPGFEADDVIGTLACKAAAEDYDVLIVTGDLDELQLIGDKVKVMKTVKGVTETVTFDEKGVTEHYGLRPEQFPDYKALTGDPSDNIPGVPGIGPKTAVKLLEEYGTIENLLEHASEVQPARFQAILEANKAQAILSKRLATIVCDVPVDVDFEQCRFKGPDLPSVREMFRELGFVSLLKRLPEPQVQPSLFGGPEEKKETLPVPSVNIIGSKSELADLTKKAQGSKFISLRAHGTSTHGVDAEPIGMAVSLGAGEAYYVAFGVTTGIRFEDLKPILASDSAKYAHNIKYEIELAQRHGLELKGPMFDVLIAAYVANATRGTHTLESIALDYLNIELPTADKNGSVSGPRGESTIEAMFASEADAISRLAPILAKKLDEDGLGSLMADVELPLIPILADMELTGVALDTAWLNELAKTLEERISRLEKEIHGLAGMDFNIGSTRQLQFVLFEKLGLQAGKKTKTGYSTDAETLAQLAPAHEIVAKILEYRELSKLKSTYADSLPKLINPRTGRIHTSLNQAVTATGRLSSSDPNLQNIPIKSEIGREIRRAFVPSAGNVLISADYSQIELRILAHVSHDAELERAFRQDEDIHVKTATRIFGVPSEEVTPDMRRQAKTVNFAVIYGMSDYGLSKALGIPTGVAKAYIESYFQEYPGVKRYTADILGKARELGYVESLLERRRYTPEVHSPNRTFREFAERAAVNMPIQGTAADIVKLAMIGIHDRLKAGGFSTKLVLQVHDELVFDAPESETGAIIPIIISAMENAYKLDVPLKVDVKVGGDWSTAMPFAVEDREEISV